MSARPEDIARLEAMDRRAGHSHRSYSRTEQEAHRETMLCPDCTLTPVVCPTCNRVGKCRPPVCDYPWKFVGELQPAIFAEAGPSADKHTSTPDGAAAYDRHRSARDES